MKTRTSSSLLLAFGFTAVLALAARNVPAQDATTASAGQTAPVLLSYGVSQIIQLSQAKVGDDTIINYIQNSGSSYGMDASQILYLKQQGVSDQVINTMISQPRVAQATASPPPSANSTAASPVTAETYAPPAVAYVPASTVYVVPDTQTQNYYGSAYRPYAGYYSYYGYPYYYYPSVSFTFGGGYRGGYYYHGGGYRGGRHH